VEKTSKVEFKDWKTPFQFGEIMILETRYGNGGGYIDFTKVEIRYEIPPAEDVDYFNLSIKLFHRETEAVYHVTFPEIAGYRVLDENGLTQLWVQGRAESYGNTCRVRGHMWSEESYLSFLGTADGMSWLICSDAECVEVLSHDEPKITKLYDVKPQPMQS
jgi:hypothetical protein